MADAWSGWPTRFREVLDRKALRLDRIAKDARVDAAELRSVVNGRTAQKRGPTLAYVTALAEACKVSASWLAFGTGEME